MKTRRAELERSIQRISRSMRTKQRGTLGWRCKSFTVALSSFALWTPLAATATAEEQAPGLAPFVTNYLDRYCYQCHGEQKQEGDRRFDQLNNGLDSNHGSIDLLEEVLDAINLGEMPPKEKGVASPNDAETKRVVQWITDFLDRSSAMKHRSATTLRRLNRFEYTNTLRDLLGLHVEALDPTGDFPVDAVSDGFDNNGDALTLSDYQLQRYLEVAEGALEKTLFFDQDRPKSNTWSFRGADFNGVTSYERAPVTWRLIINDDYVEIGHGQPSERHANYVKRFAKQGGVPSDGWYTIRIRAAAANRLDHGYEHEEFDRYRDMPLKLALWIAPNEALLGKNAADQRRLVEVWDLPDGEPEVFTARVWLGRGAIPFVSWTNGISSKGNIRKVAEKYHPEVVRATKTQNDSAGLGNADAKALVAELAKNTDNSLLSEVYRGPRIRIWGMEIDGPRWDQWPPKSHRMIIGDETDASKLDVDELMVRFASRAFRKKVKPSEIAHYANFIRARISAGDSNASAIQLGLAAILTSPRFLYLDEGDEEIESQLAQFELASRLSYFLWSSMPDDALISAAADGRLSDPAELVRHINRMLDDEKANAFVEHFTDSWLRISRLGSMPPDSKAFGSYYADRLESQFKQETRLFFADLLQRNGSVVNLLESDYTFVNDALAKHYQIDGVVGEHFRRVELLPHHHRGGLLGHGSVLTLTANGIETSPVVRGVWVLENLLGTPPSPPPPDVEPLEPDTRGTTTIREQLEKHRAVAACANCHQKIDPVGFPLELYDPIGGYRLNYPSPRGLGPVVDGSGQLHTGEFLRDERDLKGLLLDRKQQFTKTLAEKLLTYATGRSMTFRERKEIEDIASEVRDAGFGLRDLVIKVATSQTFETR